MIIAFHGPNTYRSRQKVKELFNEYRSKYGAALTVLRIDADEDDFSALKLLLEAQSLFSDRKLILVLYAFSGTRAGEMLLGEDELSSASDSKDAMLILWDGALGAEAKKRLAQWKPYVTKMQEYKELVGVQLQKWIQEEATARGARLTNTDVAHLMTLKGDGWAIVNELEKMAVAAEKEARDKESKERTIFELGDAFIQNPRSALPILYRLIEKGEDEFGLFAYLANHLRTLLIVKGYQEQGLAVAAHHNIHPFVAKKAAYAVRTIPFGRLRDTLLRFFEEDVAIKTGGSTPRESLMRILMG